MVERVDKDSLFFILFNEAFMQGRLTARQRSSAAGMLSHIPVVPRIFGKVKSAIEIKTILRQRAMAADSKGRSTAVLKLLAVMLMKESR